MKTADTLLPANDKGAGREVVDILKEQAESQGLYLWCLRCTNVFSYRDQRNLNNVGSKKMKQVPGCPACHAKTVQLLLHPEYIAITNSNYEYYFHILRAVQMHHVS